MYICDNLPRYLSNIFPKVLLICGLIVINVGALMDSSSLVLMQKIRWLCSSAYSNNVGSLVYQNLLLKLDSVYCLSLS